MSRETLFVPPAWAGSRLDEFLAESLALPKEEVRRLVREGRVTVRGRRASHLRRLSSSEPVEVERRAPTAVPSTGPEIPVLHLDDSCLVVSKPAGLPVEPAGPKSPSLVGAASRLGKFDVSGRAAPGLAHRLDRDTSGAIVLARTDRGLASLKKAFETGQVKKDYLALVAVSGRGPADEASLDTPYGRDPADPRRFTTRVASARRARLTFSVEERFEGALLLRVRLETGRTHQIRVQLSESGLPVLGDEVYGQKSNAIARQALHAEHLAFPSPAGLDVDVRAPLPEDFLLALSKLRSDGRDD